MAGKRVGDRIRRIGDPPYNAMKKALHIILEEEDVIELMRVLLDDDTEGALVFLKQHLKGKARDLLEGG